MTILPFLYAASTAFATERGIDLLWLQDLSSSAESELTDLDAQFKGMVELLYRSAPTSRVALSSYIDKPVGDFGWDNTDYCYKQHLALSELVEEEGVVYLQSSEARADLDALIDDWQVGSGKDWEEDALEAIAHGILSPYTDWDDSNGNVKLVAVVTDGGYHAYDDSLSELGLSRSMEGVDRYSEPPEEWCTTETYPSIYDMHRVIRDNDVTVMFIVTDDMVTYYERLVAELGTKKSFVVPLSGGYSTLVSALQEGLARLADDMNFATTVFDTYEDMWEAAEAIRSIETRTVNARAARTMSRTMASAASESDKVDEINVSPASDSTFATTTQTQTSSIHHILDLCRDDTVFEIVLSQDASDGFEGKIPQLVQDAVQAFNEVSSHHPGSRFALSSFVDKPVEPFGYGVDSSNDYCAMMRTPLDTDLTNFETSYSNMIIRSGADYKEAQLHGLIHPMLSLATGFTDSYVNYEGKRVVKIVAMITDSPYHVAGDAPELPSYTQQAHWYDCEGTDYPRVSDAYNALADHSVYPMFLVTPEVTEVYEDLLHNQLQINGFVGTINAEASGAYTNVTNTLLEGILRICNKEQVKVTPDNEFATTTLRELDNGDRAIEFHYNETPRFFGVVAQ